MIKSLLLYVALAALPVAGLAQLRVQEGPVGFAGEVVKISVDSVTLKDKDGKDLVVAMTRGWTVSRPRTVDSGVIKKGDFIASANKVVNDKTGQSTEVRILEAGYRPENGTHLMTQAETAMTHGTVTSAGKTAAGVELDVSYPAGTRHLVVPADVKVTEFVLLSRDLLKPGTKVSGVTRKDDKGVPRAGRLTLAP
jgi:hypothetical protein